MRTKTTTTTTTTKKSVHRLERLNVELVGGSQ